MTDEQMLRVYRHDAHKMRGKSHNGNESELFGVEVNKQVPYGADADAAGMSRPNGKPEQTLHGHETHYRRDLRTGNTQYDPDAFSLRSYRGDLQALIQGDDAGEMHAKWLRAPVVKWFNESVYYPYTSLKYHTLLVAALVYAYRQGFEFDDLRVVLVDEREEVLDRPNTSHDIVFHHDGGDIAAPFEIAIRGGKTSNGHRSTKLSSYPYRNFDSVWGRLPHHPWADMNNDRTRVIDSNLRRIRSWSTGLQYLENALEERK